MSVIVSGYDPTGDQPQAEAVLYIEGVPPKFPYNKNQDLNENLEHARQWYKSEAKKIFYVLVNNLPGGTVDQLLVLLLEHKASLFRVKA